MATPRKKKPATKNRMTFEQKRLSEIIKKVYHELYFVGASFYKPTAVNANKLFLGAQGKEVHTARRILLDHLISLKTNWPLWVGCFFNTPNGISVATADSLWEAETMLSVGGQFNKRIETVVDGIIEAENDPDCTRETLIGYGYFFSHCDIYNMSGTDERLVKLMLPYMDKHLAKEVKPEDVVVSTDLLIESIVKRGGVAKDGKIEEYIEVSEEW